jgi:2'-5' RNA ligase
VTDPVITEDQPQRLFFALWPDDATRAALDRTGKWLHQHWNGRRMRADTLHLTLAFLGSTPVALRDALLPHVDAVRAVAFELSLDQPGCWRHNRIGWLGLRQPPSPLAGLVAALRGALQDAGIAFDARPHLPHVTLLRNTAGGELPPCEPVHWNVRDFVLVASRTDAYGAHYEVVRRWPLT